MAQLNPNRYARIGSTYLYGVSYGIYYDKTDSLIVLAINDAVVLSVSSSGTILAGALEAADLNIASQARGDILRRGASAWERLAAKTSAQILIGDGTDVVSVAVSGDVTISAAGVTAIGATKVTNAMLAGSITRANLIQEALKAYPISLHEMRVWDARQTVLPGTAAADDMALVTGTFLTDVPTLQGVDFGGTSTDEKCAFQFRLPPEYDAGETVTVRLRAAMLTTVSDGTATVDVEVGKSNRDGASSADICATAATTINSLTPANIDFTITPTGLVPGDLLDIRLSFAGSDVGNLGVMIPEISQVEILLDVKG